MNLPRGVTRSTWTNADGSKTAKFRVRINRKDLKVNRYFFELAEAVDFLTLSKIKRGKKIIAEEQAQKATADLINDRTLGYFIDAYIRDYVLTRPSTTELQKRSKHNILSFYKTIKNTYVFDRTLTHEDLETMGIDTFVDPVAPPRKFSAFKITQIKAIDINHYIKARIQKKVKSSSIKRELTHISTIFSKLQYLEESLADLQNPVKLYDRDLLTDISIKREFTLSPEDEAKLFKALHNYKNREVFDIAKLSIFTAMRRSEIVTLKRSQVFDKYIQLYYTKSGRPRKVYLTPEAKTFIDGLPVKDNGRFFDYTIGGFATVWINILKEASLQHIKFHDLRRTNISRFITNNASAGSVFLTEFFGIASVEKFEQAHIIQAPPTNQATALKHFGHQYAQTTKGYYSFKFNSNNNIDAKKVK